VAHSLPSVDVTRRTDREPGGQFAANTTREVCELSLVGAFICIDGRRKADWSDVLVSCGFSISNSRQCYKNKLMCRMSSDAVNVPSRAEEMQDG
jgi:hypothetical protein